MANLDLFIGNKNLSSWSLRPWLALKAANIPFTEHLVLLDRPTSRDALAKTSPSGLVPCLRHGEIVVWDSLAICEYLAETFPEREMWPGDVKSRAVARAVCAEMHSGFTSLRAAWPMNFSNEGLRRPPALDVQKDIHRIASIWEMCRRDFGASDGSGEEFLFGRFSIADAMYAPVVSRFMTYGPVELPPLSRDYLDAVWNLEPMKKWGEGARAEAALRL